MEEKLYRLLIRNIMSIRKESRKKQKRCKKTITNSEKFDKA